MSVKQRLIKFLGHENLSQKRFAQIVGVSDGYVNAIKVSIQPKTVHKIAMQFPTLNTGWLLTGEGEMLKASYGNQEEVAGKIEEPRSPYGMSRMPEEENVTTKELIETIRFLSETVNSLQKKIEKLEAENKKINALPENNAGFADVG